MFQLLTYLFFVCVGIALSQRVLQPKYNSEDFVSRFINWCIDKLYVFGQKVKEKTPGAVNMVKEKVSSLKKKKEE